MANIQFDMDGVLADFSNGFTRFARQLGMDVPLTSDLTNPTYGTSHVVGGQDRDARIWEALLQDPYFWEYLPAAVPYDVTRRIDLMQTRHDVYFTTHRMGVAAKRQTANWLRAHGVHDPTVVLVRDKGPAAFGLKSTYSIEDKWENAVDIALLSHALSFLVNRPYNQRQTDHGVKRVDTVAQFLDYIDNEEEGK